MHLTLFDLDNTLLADDSDYLWGRFLVDNGVVDPQAYEQANQRFYAQYQAGTLDIHAFQRFSQQPLVDNPPAVMQTLRARFMDEVIRPVIAPGARALIAAHRARGDRLLVITATNRFITGPIAAELGIADMLATEPEIIDGVYTGEIAGIPCFQHGKLLRLDNWLDMQSQQFGQTWAYSDSHNDLPLLERADHPVAVDADAQLKHIATERGWPVVSLRTQAGADVFAQVT